MGKTTKTTANNDKEEETTMTVDASSSSQQFVSAKERYMKWWLEDYPPISGRLRFIVHIGIWYVSTYHPRSYFYLFKEYENTDPEMFHPRGLLGLLLGCYKMDPITIRWIATITQMAWVASAIGLFTTISSAVTAIGTVFLHGYLLDAGGGNRGFYVPTAAFVAMAFSTNSRNDIWSADYHIEQYQRRRQRRQKTDEQSSSSSSSSSAAASQSTTDDGKETNKKYVSIRETGFARKCLLVYVVGFYCASGMAKLYASGFRWADGNTMQFYVRKAKKTFLAKLLVEHPNTVGILGAAGALFLEAGAFLALLPNNNNKKVRTFFLIGWAMMHITIKFTIGRIYEQNVWCYLLLVDWEDVSSSMWKRSWWASSFQERRHNTASEKEAAGTNAYRETPRIPKIGKVPGIRISSAKFATNIGTCLLVVMAAQAILQIDWWPLTNVDMYSSYRHGDILFSFPESSYKDPIIAQEIAKSWGNRQAKGEVSNRVEIQLRRTRFDKETNTTKEKQKTLKPFGVGSQKQWRKSVFTNVIVDDFRAKPKGTIAYDPEHPDNPASVFLLHILPSLKRHVEKWKKYDYVVLAYVTTDGGSNGPVIASIPLDDAKLAKLARKSEKLKRELQPSGGHYTNTNTLLFLLVASLGVVMGGCFFPAIKVRLKAFSKNYHSKEQ